MKVRLTADMLRIRLNQPDVDALASSGKVGFTLSLGAKNVLRCALRTDATAEAIQASFADDTITVTLPDEQASRWMASNAVSLDGQVNMEGAPTQILVEKDLGCQHSGEASGAAGQTFDHLRE